MSIPLPDLLDQARRLLDQREHILARLETHGDIVESLSERLREAELDLRSSMDAKLDMDETLAEMVEELDSRPDAMGEEVREVRGALAQVIEDVEQEEEGYERSGDL